MLAVKKHGPILEPTDLDFEKTAVLNPAVWQDGQTVHLLYRAIDEDHVSRIGYARLDGPRAVAQRSISPIIVPEYDYEMRGVEDPRVVRIGDTFYMTYVAHDGKNAVTCYATSPDLLHWNKHGVISPKFTYHEAEKLMRDAHVKDAYFLFASYYEEAAGFDVRPWHKDFILFPRKIGGRFIMLQRILPDIQIVFFNDFADLTEQFWSAYLQNLSQYVILENKHWFETRNIGGGCVPVETDEGWIMIFHTVEETNKGRTYHACAALLDKENPVRVLGRLHEPLFSPEEEWERSGFVSNVVFPTGAAQFGDSLYIYYGAADKRIAVAEVSITELIAEMLNPEKRHPQAFVHRHI